MSDRDLRDEAPDAAPLPSQPQEPPAGARRAADLTDVDLTLASSFGPSVPHVAFDALRAAWGVAWHDERPIDPGTDQSFIRFVDSPGFWAVTSHALTNEVLRNPSRFSSELGATTLPTLAAESLPMLQAMLLNMDAPQHTRIRRILQPSFTPRSVERLHESVQVNTHEIIDELGADGPAELVTALSAELPLRVLADLLGMPREDRHLIFDWSNALIESDAVVESGEQAGGVDAMTSMIAYGQEMADARRVDPRDDMVSTIANAEIEGDRLTDWEFAMFWVLLVVAGNETTRNVISGSVIALLEHGLWSELAAAGSLPPTAVDELLRHVSPVVHFRRTAPEDTMLGDQLIRAGDKVVVWYGAANRDPDVFADPHRLDLSRDPNPHLAFGVGPHFCLGAHLARLEVSTMLEALLRRAPNLRLDGDPVRVPSNFINGIKTLPVHIG